MNPIAEEILSHHSEDLEAKSDVAKDILAHYGMPRRSGRYPWGSGEDPYQHGSRDFISRVEEMREQKITFTDPKTGKVHTGDTAIAKTLGLSTTQFRTEYRLASHQREMYNVATARRLRDKEGLGATEIGRRMGVRESTVRGWLTKDVKNTNLVSTQKTAEFIKKKIEEKGMIDIGKDVNRELNISAEKLKEAVYLLEREGYPVYNGRMEQQTNPGHFTTVKAICPKGTPHKDLFQFGEVHSLKEYTSHDGGETFDKFVYPKSMDSKRLKIRYAEDGGIDKDGIVEIRRGVDDLYLGDGKRYSQVRILVDNDRYIKGMAVYSDDMPDGVDVIFNTNKKKDVPMRDVLKEIKKDPENPFGSLIMPKGQSYYIDKDGNRQLSLINKRADEGDWGDWKDALPSQFLAKQSISLAKKQLDLAKIDKMEEYDNICSLENPTIKKYMLYKFAEECDSAAVELKAAALPGQKYNVIIPINTLKDTEVYAPSYEDGTKLALIRYPHGGTFEIPILTVNNKNQLANKVIGKQSMDAVGITKNVADRLSGADFDGDTVMCIPTHDKKGRVKIISTDPLKGLEGFDSKSYQYDSVTEDSDGVKHYYKNGKEFKPMSNTNLQMGIISNLITDMTLKGASTDELAAAVRHSMVVIDAEKHKLDYKQSEIDNNVASLHRRYQGHYDENGRYHAKGASTIISRSKGEYDIPKRKGSPKVNIKGKDWYDPNKPEGSLIYFDDPDASYSFTKTDEKTGKTKTINKTRTEKSTRMAEADDAHELVSAEKYPMELVYADYANSMKTLANKARVEWNNTGKLEYKPSAKAVYQEEFDSLKEKINNALLNAPREREAQRRTMAEVEAKIANDPSLKKKDIAKLRQQGITKNRNAVGAKSRKDRNIDITDREWEAIQAGAISDTMLRQILNNTDTDALRERAMPRATKSLSQAQINRIKNLAASDCSISEIASIMGKSPSTISKYLNGGK